MCSLNYNYVNGCRNKVSGAIEHGTLKQLNTGSASFRETQVLQVSGRGGINAEVLDYNAKVLDYISSMLCICMYLFYSVEGGSNQTLQIVAVVAVKFTSHKCQSCVRILIQDCATKGTPVHIVILSCVKAQHSCAPCKYGLCIGEGLMCTL